MSLEYGEAPRMKPAGVIAIIVIGVFLFGGLGVWFGMSEGFSFTKNPDALPVETSEEVALHLTIPDTAHILAALFASRGAAPIIVDTELSVLPPTKKSEDGVLPTTSARAVVVRDVASGAFLVTENAYTPVSIASITKLVSALVLLDTNINWSATNTVPDDMVADSQLFPGEVYTNDWLWQAALVGSSNRAILALVDASGLSREAFVVRMNEKARVLGMSRAVLTDPTGLEAGNQASAVDVAILLHAAMKEPRIRETLVHPSYSIERIGRAPAVVWNTNWLLLGWVPHSFVHIIGGKTGYIPESGNNVTVRIEGKDTHELDVVVLGSSTTESRFIDAKQMAEWVFQEYEWLKE
jgi:D-alanyl-D-alanine endopeptidase (penicillin-binding protein 7)